MPASDNTHIPKGGLCANCTKVNRDCSHLPFEEMRPIRTHPDGVVAVKCTEYEKLEAKLPDGYPKKSPKQWTPADAEFVRRCFHGPTGVQYFGK